MAGARAAIEARAAAPGPAPPREPPPGAARRLLALLHRAGAALAGVLLVAVGVLTLVPIAARLAGLPAHSWDEVATFCMAGSAFLGLAFAWRAGTHVRMELVVSRAGGRVGQALQVQALAVTLAACLYFTWFAGRFVALSYAMDDVSQGLLPIPLWLPQLPMVGGLALLCLAVTESLVDALRGAAAPAAAPGPDRAAGEL